jgi:hypothetical protein
VQTVQTVQTEQTVTLLVIIFINYALLVKILKKSNSITIVFIKKLNLRLIQVREYLFRFPLLICYKLSKANFVLNTLSRLLIVNNLKLRVKDAIVAPLREGELDILFAYNAFINKIAYNKVYNEFNKYYAFAVTFIKIAPDFKEKFI